jgi:serine/threonine protein kinase
MDDFIKTEGEQLIRNQEILDTDCSVNHKKSRKAFLVKSNVIGEGAFGYIYETCEKSECTYVAKVIEKLNYSQNEPYNQIIAAGHGLAPVIHEIWNCKNKVMLIMDRIKGITLQRYLENVHIDDSIKTHIIKKVFEAIDNLHAIGILHGDLHSQNIMVKEDGSIIFIDFGHSIYFEKPIIDVLLAATDIATLRKDLVKTFSNPRWLNEKAVSLQVNNNSFATKRTFIVGQRTKENISAAAAASPAEEFVPVKEEPLPEWLTPNSKENVVPLTVIETKKVNLAKEKIIDYGFFDSEDNADLIHVISTILSTLPNVLKRKVFDELKHKS